MIKLIIIILTIFWFIQFIDVCKRSKRELPSKLLWIVGLLIFWFGNPALLPWIPVIIALFYKYTVREKLDRELAVQEAEQPPPLKVKMDVNAIPNKSTKFVSRIRTSESPPPLPRRKCRRSSKKVMVRPDPTRFALILEGITPGSEEDVMEGIMIIRKCGATCAKSRLNTPSLLATDLTEQEAQGIGTEMELMGAKIRVISMKDLSEMPYQSERTAKSNEKWRYYYRNYVRNKA